MPIPDRIEPVVAQRTLLKDVVRDRLREAIRSGALHHGEALRDAELSEWLGVSRAPIRAAMDDLAREGLIEMAPNRYTRVATPNATDVLTALHMLGTLYSGAVRFAMPALPDDAGETLQTHCSIASEALRGGDFDEVRATFYPVFDELLARSGRMYRDRLTDTIDGLRFVAQIETAFHTLGGQRQFSRSADVFVVLRDALAARDVHATRSATEELFAGWVPVDTRGFADRN
ncbi:GntR family transcriptional regulator [Leifsonia aquatica]|uniref:GntR family transcriptional regulator n=1 Tax=Leifsonia aquatica TaxID=144185 RepID=UPI000468F60C|nr:GntR family transcriptional regulator [Leifsonia aquatica]